MTEVYMRPHVNPAAPAGGGRRRGQSLPE